MRLATLLIIISTLTISAKSFSQEVDLSLKNSPIEDVFNQIRQQTGYSFLWREHTLDGLPPVSVSVHKATLKETLEDCLKGLPLTYTMHGKVVYIRRKLIPDLHLIRDPKLLMPPLHVVKGIVSDSATGNPLVGVTVKVKGKSIGTVTDAEGKFSLNMPDNGVLIVSYLGYKAQEVPVDGKEELSIRLAATSTGLNQLVVVGYGTQKKGNLTGAVTTVNLTNIKSRPVTNSMQALQGRLPGVTITRQNGQPGREDYQLKIRGISSINGNAPLILINGIPGDINSVNPTDIKSVTVLRDASASIYGARAADGVILVTTKKGEESAFPRVSYSYNIAIKAPHYLKKPATALQFAKMFNQANFNDGDPQTFSNETLKKMEMNAPGTGPGENWNLTQYPMFYQNHNWYRDLFKTSERQAHNVSVAGGTDNTTYRISAGYLHDNGIFSVGENHFNRYDLRLSFHTQITRKLNLYVNNSYDNKKIVEPSQLGDAIENALKVFPYVPYRNPKGNWYTYQGYQNAFQELLKGGMRNSNYSRLRNNFKLDWEPIKGLVWTGQAAVNIEHDEDNAYYSTFYGYEWDNAKSSLVRNFPNSAYDNQWRSIYNNFTTYLNYSIPVKKHRIRLMVGASKEKFQKKTVNVSGSDFTSNEIFVLPLSNPKNLSVGDYWDNDPWSLLSYFGRVNYSYNGKYYLNATFRKDGSSKFAPSKRWSETYPSVAIAWKLSEEPFLRKYLNNNIIDFFKTRLSWGRAGNQNISALGLFDYIQQISIGGQYPIDGTTKSQAATLRGIASPNRTWETIETKDLGFDLGFFQSRLSISFDVYQKKNTDMLVSVSYPATLGASAPTTNAGSLLNKGWELNAKWKSEIGKVKFQAGIIVNYNKNKVTNLQGNDTYDVGLTFARQGYPLNSYFGYKGSIIRTNKELETYASKYAGKGIVPGTQPEGHKGLGVGDVMFQDIDGNGEITPFGDKNKGYGGDAVFLGTQTPKYTYSLNVGLQYKNFDLFMLLQGTGNKYTWRSNGAFGVPLAQYFWPPLEYFYGKTYSKDNPNAPYPRLSNSGVVKSNNYQFSSLWLVNTRYLKVANLTIGYTFQNIRLNKFNFKNARVFFSGENIFEFAKGTWDNDFDPEASSSFSNYPMYKTFSFGVNVNF